jgi:hypothetical protein
LNSELSFCALCAFLWLKLFSEIYLNSGRASQLSSVCDSRFLLVVLLHVLNDLRFELSKLTADPLFVLIVKLLRLCVRNAWYFRANLRLE